VRTGPELGVAAIGSWAAVGGFALAGVAVHVAETPDQVRAAWSALPATVGLVVLDVAAHHVLAAEQREPRAPLTVVTPE